MIYSYNKSQKDALISQFYFGKELYMFRTDLLSIVRSLNTATGISRTVMLTASEVILASPAEST